MKAAVPADKMIEMFTYKIESNQSVEHVTSILPAACEEYKFSLLQTYVYHDILKSKGFPIDRKAWVYEICRAKTAASMLTDFPHFSIFMPCRLAVYEENGKTIISTMNMEVMLGALSSNPELKDEAGKMFNKLKELMASVS